jgi:hypothetical protein
MRGGLGGQARAVNEERRKPNSRRSTRSNSVVALETENLGAVLRRVVALGLVVAVVQVRTRVARGGVCVGRWAGVDAALRGHWHTILSFSLPRGEQTRGSAPRGAAVPPATLATCERCSLING